MASRMDRYYNESSRKSRTNKNADLYGSIYDYKEYSNIEGIATIEKTNEVDIRRIKQMLNNRSDKEEVKVKPIIRDDVYEEVSIEDEVDDRNYDIRDILNKAKDEKKDDDKYRSLRNTQYDILKNLNLDDKNESKSEEDSLKDMINTISNTSMLNKMGDRELSLNMLEELKSDKTTNQATTIRQALNDMKTELNKGNVEDSIDKSFFTSSLTFGKGDFEELTDSEPKKKSKLKIVVIVILLLLVIAGVVAYFMFFKK